MLEFLNPILLPGLLVVAAPLILHLINRNRYQVVPWGAYQLLSAAFRVRARRVRLEQLLLLALRMLLLALFALALSRMVIRHGMAGLSRPLASHVLLIDGSYSMGRMTESGPLFDRAKDAAIRFIRKLRKGEDVQVIVAGQVPRPLSLRPEFETEELVRRIGELELQTEPADFLAAMDLALQAFRETKNPARRLLAFSDGQKYGWQTGQTTKWSYLRMLRETMSPGIACVGLIEDAPEKPNFSVSPIRLDGVAATTAETCRFRVTLRSHYPRPAACILHLELDGRELERRERSQDPGEAGDEILDVRFEQPGQHGLVARLGSDLIPGDNESFLAVNALGPVPVLVADGAYSDDLLRSGGGYLLAALLPKPDADGQPLFVPKHVRMSDLREEPLETFRTVVLVNPGDLGAEDVTRLERFVERGGGLLVSCGEGTRPAELYRALYKDGLGLLPAGPIGTRTAGPDERPFSPFFPGTHTRLFPFLRRGEGQRLPELLVRQFVECDVTAEDEQRGTQVLAEFLGRKPFLLLKNFGGGRVILWTSSLDLSWGNLPSQWSYVPLVHCLVLGLGTGSSSGSQVMQGDRLVARFPGPVDPPRLFVQPPRGGVEEVVAQLDGSDLVLAYAKTSRPGIYRISPDRGFPREATQSFAVNPDLNESDLSPLTAEFKTFLHEAFSMDFRAGYDDESDTESPPGVVDAWRWLIVAALGALILETLVASRITRDSRTSWES